MVICYKTLSSLSHRTKDLENWINYLINLIKNTKMKKKILSFI